MRPQFTLSQLVMAVWLVAIVLGLVMSDVFSIRFCKVSDLAFSPDGEHVAAARRDARGAGADNILDDVSRTISILNAATGRMERIVERAVPSRDQGSLSDRYSYSHPQKTVAFGLQGKTLLVQQFRGGGVKTYDLVSGQWGYTVKGSPSGRDMSFAVTPDGTRAAVIVAGSLISWDVGTGQTKAMANPGTRDADRWYDPPRIAISSDGSICAIADVSAVYLRNAADGSAGASVCGVAGEDTVLRLALSPNGRMLAVVFWKSLKLYDLTSLRITEFAAGRWMENIAFSPDGKILAVADGKHVDLMEVASGRTIRSVRSDGYATSVACSPKQELLAVGDGDGCVTLWNTVTGDKIWTTMAPGNPAVSWVWSVLSLLLWIAVWRITVIRRRKARQAQASPSPGG